MKGYTIQNSINELEEKVEKLKGSGGASTAAEVSYDNTTSHLTADDVQEAIDELSASIDALEVSSVLYNTTESQIGVLSDNTPVYEKTFILSDTDVPVSGTPKAISVDEGITILDINGVLTFADEVTPLDFYLNVGFFSNCREVISDHALYISATFTGKTCTQALVKIIYTKPAPQSNTRSKKK